MLYFSRFAIPRGVFRGMIMFVKAVMDESGKWNHQVNRHSPVVVCRFSTPSRFQSNTLFLRVDNITIFLYLVDTTNGPRLYYSLEAYLDLGKFTQEDGEFTGFDSVSAIFCGIRFHWSRESEKVVVSDALAGRRDFDSLTIE